MDCVNLQENTEYVRTLLEIADEFEISELDGHVVIDGDVIISVSRFDFWIDPSENIIIEDCAGIAIGSICAQTFSTEEVDIQSSSYTTMKCFLVDTSNVNDININAYRFNKKYISIFKEKYSEYKDKYQKSSILWGGYSHEYLSTDYIKSVEKVRAIEGIHLPTNINYLSLQRSVNSNNCFDKFLSLYHQFELIFDLVFVKKIKSIEEAQLTDISKIIKRYAGGNSELELLRNIIEDFCVEHLELQSYLNAMKVISHVNTMKDIFQDFTKTTNPLTDEQFAKLISLMESNSLTIDTFSRDVARMKNNEEYRVKLIRIIAYWLYRIRCSVAHNRIGEFVFNDSHQKFVDEIGIYLLKNVLIQSFKSINFKQIMT